MVQDNIYPYMLPCWLYPPEMNLSASFVNKTKNDFPSNKHDEFSKLARMM